MTAPTCGELSCDECNARTAELTAERDQLRAEVERLRSDRDCEKRLRKDADEFRENAIARAERAEAELATERAIVSRIWTQLGSATYEQLRGRSIYDLIDELKANATSSAPRWKREREWQAGIIAHAQLHHAERKEAIARAERAEAELAKERARLDHMSARVFEHRHHETGDHLGCEWTISSYSESEDVTLRDVIDAEMREDAK